MIELDVFCFTKQLFRSVCLWCGWVRAYACVQNYMFKIMDVNILKVT
jgi:hypothetical protein